MITSDLSWHRLLQLSDPFAPRLLSEVLKKAKSAKELISIIYFISLNDVEEPEFQLS